MTTNWLVSCAVLGGFLLPVSASAEDMILPREALADTVWVAGDTHDRTTIAPDGTISMKEGKNIYVAFGDLIDGVYTITIHWWNVEAGINVMEYAVLVPEQANVYDYSETLHPEDSGFPGIQGSGTFTLLDETTAEFTQIGHLIDGSASAFVTRLTKADAPPEVPIPQTYPKP